MISLLECTDVQPQCVAGGKEHSAGTYTHDTWRVSSSIYMRTSQSIISMPVHGLVYACTWFPAI